MAVQLDDLVARLRLDTSGLEAGMRNVAGSLSGVGSKMASTGKQMTAGLTLPLAGVAIAGVKLSADFGKTMRQVEIATGGPSKALKDLAMTMGADTAFSAGEAASAMLELAKGGMTSAQIQGGALQSTMKLAAAGGVDLASAATYVGNSMAAFGLKAKDADAVTVALAGAANASSASVESLGMGLSQSALAAKNAGLSLQQTTGVLSLFDAAGVKGSDAGTSLKTMLTRLVPSTKEARTEMKALGLDFTNADGSFVSIGNVAQQLKEKLGPLSEEQRTQALATIFGSDAARAATVLMESGAKGVEKYTKASRDSKTTTELANAAMEGTSGALEKAMGSMETAALTLGDVLAPYVEKLAGYVEKAANWFSELDGETRTMIIGLGGVAAAIGPLLIAFGAAAKGASSIISLGATTVGAIGKIGSAAGAAKTGLTNLSAGFTSSQAAASAFTGKMGTIGGALRSTVTAMASATAAAARWAASTVAAAARAVASMTATVARMVAGWVLMAAQSLAQAARMAAAWLIALGPIGWAIAAVIAVVAAVVLNWDKVKAATEAVWSAVSGFVSSAWEKIKSAVSTAANAVKAVISAVFTAIKVVVTTYVTIWRTIITTAWNVIKTVVTTAVNAVRAVITSVFNVVKGVVTTAVNGWRSAIDTAWDAIKRVVTSAVDAVKSAVSKAFDTVKSAVSGAMSSVRSVVSSAWDSVKSATTNAWNSVKNAVQNGVSNVMSVVRSLPERIKGACSGAASWLLSAGVNIVRGLIDGLKSMAGAITSTLVGLLPGPLQKFAAKLGIASPSKVFEQFGKFVGQGFVNGIDGTRESVASSFDGLVEKLRETSRGALTKLVVETREQLMGLAKQYEDQGKLIETASERLKSALDLRASIKDTVVGTGSIFGAEAATDAEGNALPLQFADIAAHLQTAKTNAEAFTKAGRQLKELGLNQSILNEILAKGPEAGLVAAQAILAQGDGAVKQVNRLSKAVREEGAKIGELAVKNMYGAGVQTMRGLIKGLKDHEDELREQMRRIAEIMAKTVKSELKIKSPSRVFSEIGADTGAGFVVGLDSMARSVESAAVRMTRAAVVDSPVLTHASARVAGVRSPRAAVASSSQQSINVRVFVGDRELTDMVRVEIADTLAPLTTLTRQGAI